MNLTLAPWEVSDGRQEEVHCRDLESDDAWMWGEIGDLFPYLIGRRHDQDVNFNSWVGHGHKPYWVHLRYSAHSGDERRRTLCALQWKEAIQSARVGHLFYVDDAFDLLAHPQQGAWRVFLGANGLGGWQRLTSFPNEGNSGDIVQNEPQSFRWHNQEKSAWLERPALEWFASFQTLANQEKSDVHFASLWAIKKREERYTLSVSTQHDTLELFLRVLHLAIQTDVELCHNTPYIGCQLQLTDDTPPDESLSFWLRKGGESAEPTPRFKRLFGAAIEYFAPRRGSKLADDYSCVRQWLDEYNRTDLSFYLVPPTQHERMEALLELQEILHERGIDRQNLLL